MSLTTFGNTPYGNVKLNFFSGHKYGRFDDLVEPEEVEKSLVSILAGRGSEINAFVIHRKLYSFLEHSPTTLVEIVSNVLNGVSLKYGDDVDETKEEKGFVTDQILKYNEYCQNLGHLNRALSSFTQSVTYTGKNNKTYSYLYFLSSAYFFRNVIARKYTIKGKDYNYFPLLSRHASYIVSIEDLMGQFSKCLKMQEHFSILAKVFQGTEYFPATYTELIANMGSNINFVRSLVQQVHSALIKHHETGKSNTKNLFSMLDIPLKFNERTVFDMIYGELLTQRLFIPNVDISLEEKIINMFKGKHATKLMRSMIYQIMDIRRSQEDLKLMNGVKINLTSGTYSGKVFEQYLKLKSKVVPKLLRHYAWPKIVEQSEYEPPKELKIFLIISERYYNKRYRDRKMEWALDYGLAINTINIGDVEYTFQVTTPQLLVMMLFNGNEKLSGSEISKKLNMPLSTVGKILNGFIKLKLFKREDGDSSDTSLKFFVNPEFKFPTNKISLVALMNGPTNKEVQKQLAIGRFNILQARVVKVMKQKKEMNRDELFEECKKDLPFEPTDKLFTKTLVMLTTKKYLNKSGEKYEYNEDEDSDSDEDDDQ